MTFNYYLSTVITIAFKYYKYVNILNFFFF